MLLYDPRSAYLKAGLVYLGWVPPKINRIYLVPEDPDARKRRRKQGGSRGKLYTEGWLEFVKRKDAKRAALMLHNEPVGMAYQTTGCQLSGGTHSITL